MCGWRARSVYSFGVVCWELLTRRCPYEGLNHIQVCVRVRHGWVGWDLMHVVVVLAQVAMAIIKDRKTLELPSSTPEGTYARASEGLRVSRWWFACSLFEHGSELLGRGSDEAAELFGGQ